MSILAKQAEVSNNEQITSQALQKSTEWTLEEMGLQAATDERSHQNKLQFIRKIKQLMDTVTK